MNLLIDMSCINPKNIHASIPTYIIKLVDSFHSNGIPNITLLADISQFKSFSQRYPNYNIHAIKRNYLLYRIPVISDIYARHTYKKALSKIDCDTVLIASDQDRGTIAEIPQKKIVVIHDLKGIKTTSRIINFKNLTFYKELAKQASAIVAISGFTKKEIIQYLSISENKIHIIPNSVSLSNSSTRIDGIPNKYILYVNTLQPHKNIQTLIAAYNKCKFKNEYKLIIVGKETAFWKNQVKSLIKHNKLEQNIIHLKGLSNEELHYVYENASLFITTSLHEGFGYTPIEAAICGIPVISSTSEALKESTQGLLNYYEPADDYIALSKKIDEIISTPPSKAKLFIIAEKFKRDYSPKNQLNRFIHITNAYKTLNTNA
jgi:glycosyltransferase involved in cell wall biosynthesis